METSLIKNPEIKTLISRLLNQETHLSFSSLMAFRDSPQTFINYKFGQKEETEAMVYGAMVHCLVLEPEDFNNRYHCLDDRDICAQIGGAKPRATKAYKEWKEAAMAECGNKTLVETDEFLHAQRVAKNILTNEASAKIMSLCPQRETKLEWNFLNFRFLGYKDLDGEKARADLKTCPDANPRKFQREIADKGYHIQAAMYSYGSGDNKPYYIIAVDKKGGVSVNKLPERMMEIGLIQYQWLVDKFNECILKDAFHKSYDFYSPRYDGIFDADIPAYLYNLPE